MSKRKGLTKKQLRKERKAKKAAALSRLSDERPQRNRKNKKSNGMHEEQPGNEVEMDSNNEDSSSSVQDISTSVVNANMSTEDMQMNTTSEPTVTESHRAKKVNIRIKGVGQEASLDYNVHERIPLLLSDVQHLMLTASLESCHPYSSPRWVAIEKRSSLLQTLVLIVDGLSTQHYQKHESNLQNLKKFSIKCEVVTPSLYGGSIIDELATVPLTDSETEALVQEYGSVEAAMQARKDLMVMLRMVFPVKENMGHSSPRNSLPDNFPRTQLILSAWQLVEENYPLPLKGKLMNNYAGYVMTKDVYEPVSSASPMFGLDCEMCKTVVGNELTRISLVNENHEVIYETLVLPHNKIVDYLTRYSGITAQMMADVTTRVSDVQKDIREILPPNAILVGQSLNFDLHALKMMHPYVIDTSIIFNTTGERNRKSKLKILAKTFLKEDIQEGSKGHCSVEDSIASLKLVQLKLANDISFGDAILASRNKLTQQNQRKISRTEYSTNIYNKLAQHEKTSIVVGHESITQKYSNYVKRVCKVKSESGVGKHRKIKCINCEDNGGVIETTRDLLTGKHNLVMTHLNMQSDINENCDNVMNVVDGWVGDLHNSCPVNTLFVVLFSGTKSCNGTCFVAVKRTL